MVMVGHRHLTAIVWGHIVLKCSTYLLALYSEVDTDGDSCKDIVDVVSSHEMSLYLMPLYRPATLLNLHQRLTPSNLQERIAGDDLAADTIILFFRICGIRCYPQSIIVINLVCKVLIVSIKEYKSILSGSQKVV